MREYHYRWQRSWPAEYRSAFQTFLYRSFPQGGHGGNARVARVVYAASDPKTGAAGSKFDTLLSEQHNHRVEVLGGVLADESALLLREFFRARR